jgi:hypothetical protein
MQGVEGERRLARSGQSGQDDEPVLRDVDGDVLEIVQAGAPDPDLVIRPDGLRACRDIGV